MPCVALPLRARSRRVSRRDFGGTGGRGTVERTVHGPGTNAVLGRKRNKLGGAQAQHSTAAQRGGRAWTGGGGGGGGRGSGRRGRGVVVVGGGGGGNCHDDGWG